MVTALIPNTKVEDSIDAFQSSLRVSTSVSAYGRSKELSGTLDFNLTGKGIECSFCLEGPHDGDNFFSERLELRPFLLDRIIDGRFDCKTIEVTASSLDRMFRKERRFDPNSSGSEITVSERSVEPLAEAYVGWVAKTISANYTIIANAKLHEGSLTTTLRFMRHDVSQSTMVFRYDLKPVEGLFREMMEAT